MNEMLLRPLMIIFRAAFLHTEVFILLSGFLVANSLLKRLQRGQKIDIWREIFSRYLRLMPPVAILMIFVTFILPALGNGPLWPMLIEKQAEICRENWLRNIFMSQNLFGLKNMCMMHTHHVATDFQLFLVAPIIVIMLHKYPKRSSVGLMAAAGLSTVGRFLMSYVGGYSLFVTAGSRLVMEKKFC